MGEFCNFEDFPAKRLVSVIPDLGRANRGKQGWETYERIPLLPVEQVSPVSGEGVTGGCADFGLKYWRVQV